MSLRRDDIKYDMPVSSFLCFVLFLDPFRELLLPHVRVS